jgi:hypothetical protein
VQGHEPCPREPHPAPPAERLRKTPLGEQGELIVFIPTDRVKEYDHNKFVIKPDELKDPVAGAPGPVLASSTAPGFR